jgi:cardiolipin synthase
MNSAQMIKHSQALLRAAGAVPIRRKGGHEAWRFPSRAVYPLQVHPGPWRSPRLFKKVTASIRRAARAERVPCVLGALLLVAGLAGCAHVEQHLKLPDLAMGDPSFGPTIEAYTATRVVGGNTVDLLLNGDQIFPAILKAIRSARTTITYAQYFYESGEMPQQIAEALAARCRVGVRAHVLLDGFGAFTMPASYRQTMMDAGCEVVTFRPLSPLALFGPLGFGGKSDNRSHRRILVVDGRVGFTGGVGVSPSWTGNGRTKDHWRQTDVRIEGPVVASLQGAFVENWLEATGAVLGGEAYFPRLTPRGAVTAQVVHSSPAEGSFSMYTMFLLAMSSARHSIYITNPYFLLDTRMTRALTEASKRGVRVVLLLPGPIDNYMVRHASRAGFGALFKAGIEIHEYQVGLLHAKTMVIDGVWATVGSTNLDTRSFALNEEVNLVVYSPDVAARLERVFADDLGYAKRINPETWRYRGAWERMLEVLSLPVRREF